MRAVTYSLPEVSQMIDIDKEQLVPISKAGGHFPGRRPCRETVYRWLLRGAAVQGTNERVKLESVRQGGLRYTSHEAIKRFLAAQNPDLPTEPQEQADQRSELARQELEAMGIHTRE